MKKALKTLLSLLVGLVAGIFLGIGMVFLLEHFNALESIDNLFFYFIILLVAYFLQIIVHEAGHLVFGLLTGYQFLSFRIGSLMLVKQDGKLQFTRFHVPGTGGQCLMIPNPDYNVYKLYHAGGSLMNLIFALICLIVLLLEPNNAYLVLFLVFSLMIAIFVAGLNGIPMKVEGMSNDGNNLRLALKDEKTRIALFYQLEMNAWIYSNKPIKDYSVEKFYSFLNDDYSNPFVASMINYIACFDMATGNFDRAYHLMEKLYQTPKLLAVIKNEVACEYAFLKMIKGESKEEVDKVLDKALWKYIKAMEKYTLSKLRLQYAYTCIYENDVTKKIEIFDKKNKYVPKMPNTSELGMEEELFSYVQNHFDV